MLVGLVFWESIKGWALLYRLLGLVGKWLKSVCFWETINCATWKPPWRIQLGIQNRGLFGGSQMLLSLCDFFNLSRNLVLDTHWGRLGPTECLAAHDAKGEQVQHLFLKIFQLVPLLLKFYLVDNLVVGSIFVHNHIYYLHGPKINDAQMVCC